MKSIWKKKIEEIEEIIRNTDSGNTERLNELGLKKEWLEFAFQSVGV